MTNITQKSEHPILAAHDTVLVVGLGMTGYSVVRHLHAMGLRVSVMDTRSAPPYAKALADKFPTVRSYFGGIDKDVVLQFRLIVVSPGIDLREHTFRRARKAGAEIIGDVDLFIALNRKPLIAITGSNGKSTVTTLVGEMCRAGGLQPLVAGNIGSPMLDALTDHVDYDVAVLELSSFQLETTSHMPADAAAILNITPDHMDRYASMGDYVLAKARILRGAKRAILPLHDENLQQITKVTEAVNFALEEPADERQYGLARVNNLRYLMHGQQKIMRMRDLSLLGLHNVENVLAAFALVEFLALDQAQLVAAVAEFKGLPHRMETVAANDGVVWVNDSKATNVGATSTALRSLEHETIWLAGGQGKGADFSGLRDAVTANIKQLILLGEDAEQIAAALDGCLPIQRVKSMAEAVACAGELATNGCIVLLSPACASFDMYRSFEHRGEDFRDCVKTWIGERAA